MKKSNLIFKIGMLSAITLLISSCASLSTMQTARVVEKGEIVTTIGGGTVKTDIPIGTLDTMNLKMPLMEIGARYALGNNFDIGAKITLIGTAVVDGKYQFLGDNKSFLAGSIGLGLGYFSVKSGESKSEFYDIMVPTYFSVHPIKWVSIYTSPKYIMRINSFSNGKTTGNGTSHWYGGTVGLKLGNKTGFLIEYSYFKQSQLKTPFTQITAGICFSPGN